MHEIILFLAALFAFNFWWALAIIVVAWGILTALVETEHGGWATFTLFVAFAAYTSWAKYAVVPYVKTHFFSLILGALGYLAIGIVWSFFAKWPLFIKKHINIYNDAKVKFLKDTPQYTTFPTDAKGIDEFKKYLSQWVTRDLELNPQVDNHIGDLTRWAAWWPWSMFWFVFNNPVRRIVESAIRLFRGFLQGISNKMTAHIREELTPTTPTPEPESGVPTQFKQNKNRRGIEISD